MHTAHRLSSCVESSVRGAGGGRGGCYLSVGDEEAAGAEVAVALQVLGEGVRGGEVEEGQEVVEVMGARYGAGGRMWDMATLR